MSTTLLSKFLYVASLIVVVGSIVRWYFIFPDISQLAFGLSGAISIIIGAYVHSAFRNLGNDLRESNELREKQIGELNNALDTAINYTREVEAQIKKE